MFRKRSLNAGLALVLAVGLASLSLSVISTARGESAQETAIGRDALDAAGAGAAATAPYYYPQPYYPSHCYPPYPPPYPEGCPY
jgi:hypothetical protein